MGTFYLDEQPIPFNDGENVLEAARQAGVEIPYFCYHPALGSLGACRLCMVELAPTREGDRPRLLASCTLAAKEGMQVSLKAPRAADARQAMIEFVMTNHPHDCPVCDEGGECHLQNMTVRVGPPYRRYEGTKRTFLNQYLGPLLWHDMDRCITCYRCVRFYQDAALGDDLGVFGSRNRVYFGRAKGGPLENPFAGNLVEVCPTGVFTDKVFRRHFSRVWDLQTAPSVCPHCSVGCNTLPGAREGTLRRVTNRPNQRINHWFICDRGRYGHRYTENPRRPLRGRIDGRGGDVAEVLEAIALRLSDAEGDIAGLGSVREDMEANAALRSLMAALGGWYSALASPTLEGAIAAAAAASDNAPTLEDITRSDAVLVVGDLTGHAPMMDLAVRQVVRAGHPIMVIHSVPAPLSAHARHTLQLSPRELSEALTGLSKRTKDRKTRISAELKRVRDTLGKAHRPVILGVAETLGAPGCRALAHMASALKARLGFALPGANAFGTALLSRPGDSERVLRWVKSGQVHSLIVVGSDPFGSDPGAERWRALRNQLRFLLVLDCLSTETVAQADAFIPLAAWAERAGTFVNYAGLGQGFDRVFARKEPLPDAYTALCDLGQAMGLGRLRRNAEILAYKYFNRPAQAGRTGIQVEPAAYTHLQASAEGDLESIQHAAGRWQAALTTWYGDDPLAAHAPELTELTPAPGVRMTPKLARECALVPGEALMLRGPAGKLNLPLITDSQCAQDTLGLARAAMVTLGVTEGESVEWERVT
jgi:NADH-quinone oxidoreductase subunit G